MTLAGRLFQLQTLDSRIAALEATLASLDDGSALQAQLEAAKVAEDEARSALHESQARLRTLELELQSAVGKAKKLEQDLYSGRVTNPKELQAMEQDIQMLSRQRGRLEDEMLGLMEQIERMLEEVRRIETERQTKERDLEAHLQAYRQRREELSAELETARGEREAFAPQLDADLLRRYERLRSRKDGVAVVTIVNGVCGGCHFKLPERLVVDVKEVDVIRTCEECGRILYAGS